jgi:p-cumate 2,3-dioxygenase alpha subunit
MNIETLVRDQPDINRFSVHRSAMTSASIFEQETAQIFERTWLYVGHEDEIPEPGDYRRRSAAARPLIFVRGSDNVIRVLYNTCTHRGAQVCRQDSGRASVFQCFYHSWSFNNQGTLVGVPDEASYGSLFSKDEFALKAVPRLEQYRGMYFVSFDPAIVNLETYLGPARKLIDLTLDSAQSLGGWALLAGSAQYSIRANWKLMVENSYDGYHIPLHQTYLDYVAWRAKMNGKSASGGATIMARGGTGSAALPNGHGIVLMEARGRGIANPSPMWSDETNAEVDHVKNANITLFGEQRGREMCEVSRWLVIYPNFAFQDTQSGFRLRLITPVSANSTDIQQWELAPRNESRDLRCARMELSLAFLGPGGFATPDDVEALESCQNGFAAKGVEWSDISRGMERELPLATDELQMRAFWRQWQAHIRGERGLTNTGDSARETARILDDGILVHA